MFSVTLLAMAACAAAVSAFVVRHLRRRYVESERFRRATLFPQADSIPSLGAAMPLINREIARARRHDRPLGVVVLEVSTGELLRQIQRIVSSGHNGSSSEHQQAAKVGRVVFGLIGSVLRHTLRDSDVLAYDPRTDHYILVLPEADRLGTEAAVGRMSDMLIERVAVRPRTGIAVLLADGVIFENLVSAAEAKCGARYAVIARTVA